MTALLALIFFSCAVRRIARARSGGRFLKVIGFMAANHHASLMHHYDADQEVIQLGVVAGRGSISASVLYAFAVAFPRSCSARIGSL